MCPWHHKVVHDRGYTIAPPPGRARPSTARTAPRCPPARPCPSRRPVDAAHDADITPDTIIPPWYGERLDLNHAIWACFANARTREERDGTTTATRRRVTIYEPEDWPERIRRYEDEYPAGPRRPLVVPIPLLGCAHA